MSINSLVSFGYFKVTNLFSLHQMYWMVNGFYFLLFTCLCGHFGRYVLVISWHHLSARETLGQSKRWTGCHLMVCLANSSGYQNPTVILFRMTCVQGFNSTKRK